MSIEAIVGLTVRQAMHFEESRIYLVGEMNGAPCTYLLECQADCCASAYVAGVNNPEALVNATILSVEDLMVTDAMTAAVRASEGADHDVLDVWGHRINTTKGTCVLDCRTSHNGYYGGSMYAMEFKGEIPQLASQLKER